MTNPKLKLATWKPTKVDEPWKKRVVLDERQTAIRTISGLCTILFNGLPPGVSATDFNAQCDVIASLSGQEIAEQLKQYWRVVGANLDECKGMSTFDPKPED